MTEYYQPVAEKPKDTASESPESSFNYDKKDKKKDKKKDAKRKLVLGSTAADKIVETPAEPPKKPEQIDEQKQTVFERFVKDADDESDNKTAANEKSDESDKSHGSQISEIAKDEPRPESTELSEVSLEDEKLNEQSELSELSHEETQEVVHEYVATRQEMLSKSQAVIKKETLDSDETENPELDIETAANVALLASLEKNIANNPDSTIEQALDVAEAETTEIIEQLSPTEKNSPDDSTETVESETLETEAASQHEAEPDTIEIESDATPPMSGTGDGSRGTGNPPPGSNNPPGAAMPPLPPMPPLQPPFGAATPLSFGPHGSGAGGGHGAGFNMPPTAPNTVVIRDITSERRAAGQGLLVGGIVGYLIGKRRGRIKAEKRLLPIQKKLEKQVDALHSAVAAKELTVKKLAAEKSRQLATDEERRKFANRLHPAVKQSKIEGRKAQADRQEGVKIVARPEQELSSARQSREQFAARQAGEAYTAPRPVVERMGKVLVEVPAAVVLGGAAALRGERSGERAGQTVRGVVDFSKKIEAYTTTELKQAAEKVKMNGTNLKELYETGRLDEKAVRRVLREFVEGGSVNTAVNKELLEKELKYERDPKLRQAAGGLIAQAGSTTADAHAHSGVAAIAGAAATAAISDGSSNSAGKKPVPDKVTLDKIRKQQMTELAIGTGAIVVIIAAIIAAL